MELTQKVLEKVKDYVVVVGSYSKGTQNENSDIDLLIKTKPEELWEDGEDTYKNEVKAVLEELGVECRSDLIDSFITTNTEIPLDFSTLFDEPENIIKNNIFGVEMEFSKWAN